MALWFYRTLFGYTKWAYPTVELQDEADQSRKHRRFWYVIVTGIVASIIASSVLSLAS
jgi:hypothetical protein